MHEPEVFNSSPFKTAVLPYVDRQGRDARLVLMKASFAIADSGETTLLEEQREIRVGNEPWDDPEASDNRFASELCEYKPGTDVLIAGHAVAPHGRPSTALDVAIRVADRSLLMRAHGPRFWQGLGPSLGPALPTTKVPLRWGLAFGGLDARDPKRPLECAENPVGLGVAADPKTLANQPAPQLEIPAHPTKAPNRGTPVGVGPMGPNFAQRRALAGTYDEAWLQNTYPARPRDYDPRYENLAPHPFQFERPLRGREACALYGMREDGRVLAFEIPLERVRIEWVIDGVRSGVDPHLDTVVIDTDASVVEMIFRTIIPTPAKMRNHFTEVHMLRKRLESR